MFERLAVFAGGWHADAATAVAGHDRPGHVDRALDQLAERSLISAAASADQTRWNMLEPVRAWAGHQLARRGEADATQDRHARYFAEFAERAAAGLRGPAERHWAEQLTVELGNLRAAHRWLVDNNRPDTALQLASACYPWVCAGAPAEVAGWAREAAGRYSDADHPALAGALATAAAGAWRHGDAETAITLASRGAELDPGGAPATPWALDALGDANVIADRYEQAINAYRAPSRSPKPPQTPSQCATAWEVSAGSG